MNEGLCNSITSDLVIENMFCLESITVMKNSLKKVNKLTVTNNENLLSFTTEHGKGNSFYCGLQLGAFYDVTEVTFSSIANFVLLSVRSS